MPSLNVVEFLDQDEEPFIEVDPSGRYGRYEGLLGEGGQKKVYRAFDQREGIEVAWNQVNLHKFIDNKVILDQIKTEVKVLGSLKHENILTFYHSWIDVPKKRLNFITEVFFSGSLSSYTKKHRRVSKRGVKKWCRQILRGVEYLHTHNPCIIHADLKLKIGDFGMSKIVGVDHVAHLVSGGTQEFMAPEMYDGTYTETVDIYAFGMCLMEMVTGELPYMECKGRVQIFEKVSSGVKPHSLEKVKDPEIKAFILKCLGKPGDRPSATELLQNSFFAGLDGDDDDKA
ncbi:non-specific serine/threonine protein kinase [Ranunculus cassubicifolius]